MTLKENEIRVIKVNEAAVRELIFETIIENAQEYFNLSNTEDICYTIQMDIQTGNMICIAHEADIPEEKIDVDKIDKETEITTPSFFVSDRYISKFLT